MKFLTIARATGRYQDKSDLTITFEGEPPEDMTRKEAEAFYREEARKLADALLETLPGGTADQFLAKLMQKRASLLRPPLR